jgi:RNA polymerase sigma-70 factor (ECF subfamily)
VSSKPSGSTITGIISEDEDLLRLVNQAQAGDGEAFAELWHRHERRVRALVSRYLGYRNNDVPDLLQQTLYTAFRSMRELNDLSRFSGWLSRIAKNKCLDYLRKERYEVPLKEANNLIEPRSNESLSMQLKIAEQILHGMRQLDQEILRRVCWDGYSTSETASTLGIKTQAVYDTVKRFRRKLRKALNSDRVNNENARASAREKL